MTATKTTFTRTPAEFAEDGATWEIARDGMAIGEIVQNMRNAGCILRKQWVTCSYDVWIWGGDTEDRTARKALSAAKRWAKSK